jgi:hypothetical protein
MSGITKREKLFSLIDLMMSGMEKKNFSLIDHKMSGMGKTFFYGEKFSMEKNFSIKEKKLFHS